MKELIYYFFISILFLIGCSKTVSEPTYIVPAIKNISITNSENGIALSWNVELLAGFEKRVYILRNVSMSLIQRVGETDQNSFVDQYIDVGKAYYYMIQIVEENQSTNGGHTSYSITSDIIPSPVSVAGKGEIDTVSNIVLQSGGGKIKLSWSAITNVTDNNCIKTYEIYRRRYENGQTASGRVFTTLNTSYTDTDFTYGDSEDGTYYYTIIPIITSTDGNIKYYGLESDPVSGIPNLSTP